MHAEPFGPYNGPLCDPLRKRLRATSGGSPGGLVAWEQTIANPVAGRYANAIYGKWHIGAETGRFPTDHGFDEWYGIPNSYDECLWPDDPLYIPERDGMSFVVAGIKGGPVDNLEQLTMEVRRNIDLDI